MKFAVWAGWVINEVVRARLRGLEIVTLSLHEYGIYNYGDIIFTSQDLLARDPGLAERFLRASLRGWEWAVTNPIDAVSIFLERFNDMASEREFHLAAFDASIPLIVPGGRRLGALDCQSKQIQELQIPDDFCTTKILERVWDEE